MAAAQAGETLQVDLETCTIERGDEAYPFSIDARARARLLARLDAIGETLKESDLIGSLEAQLSGTMPWLPAHREEVRHAG